MDNENGTERYRGPDRRKPSLIGTTKGLFLARRRTRRRDSDSGAYVDHFSAQWLLWALGVPLLSCLDAFWTVHLLEHGGRELNPVMKWLLDWDVRAFVTGKVLITILCVLFLLAHGHFRVAGALRVRHVMYLLLGAYIALIVYEIGLVRLTQDHT